MIYIIALIAGTAGFLFGFDEGVLAGVLHQLRDTFQLTENSEGVISSALPLGALFAAIFLGSLLAIKLTRTVGRRTLLAYIAILFIVGTVIAVCAHHLPLLFIGRLLIGVAIGFASVVTPLYIAETAPANIRGTLVAVFQLAVTFGILCAYLTNYILLDVVSWRGIFMISAIPALFVLLGMLILPESPRWLLLNKRQEEARAILIKLRNTSEVDAEINEIVEAITEEHGQTDWRELISPSIRPALIVGMGLFILQQFSGINTVITYAPLIFEKVGFSTTKTQIFATVGIGFINFIMTILSLWLIESLGRKKLLFIGFIGTGLALAAISVSMQFQFPHVAWITFTALLIYIAMFAISLGPVPYVMMSEIFPLNVRSTGMGLASMCNWGFNFVVLLTFPAMLGWFGLANTYWLYAACCAFGLWFTWRYVPETQGITLEKIEHHLHMGKSLRSLSP